MNTFYSAVHRKDIKTRVLRTCANGCQLKLPNTKSPRSPKAKSPKYKLPKCKVAQMIIVRNSRKGYGKMVLIQSFHISETKCLSESYDLWICIYRKFPMQWQHPNASISDSFEYMKNLMLCTTFASCTIALSVKYKLSIIFWYHLIQHIPAIVHVMCIYDTRQTFAVLPNLFTLY